MGSKFVYAEGEEKLFYVLLFLFTILFFSYGVVNIRKVKGVHFIHVAIYSGLAYALVGSIYVV